MLTGKRIVVTGASRGLGRAYAVALARQGARLVVNGTDVAALDETLGSISRAGGEALAAVGSVADDEAARAMIGTCVDAYGGIDVLVNNAGVIHQRMLHRMQPDEFDDEIAVNLRGTWSTSRHAIAAMREGSGGLLLQIVSTSAVTGCLGQTGYAAAKAGVIAMMLAWDAELAGTGIRVNALCPAAVSGTSQEFIGRLQAAAAKRGDPVPTAREIGFGETGEIADLVVLLCSDQAAALNSQLLEFNGRKLVAWTHPSPAWTVERSSWGTADLLAALGVAQQPVARPG
jgi:3-oxoacyl-[acyl-carrier protein] reductase